MSAENELIWKRYDFSKMPYEFCQHTLFYEETSPNYFPKHPNQHPSLYFNNLTLINPKSKVEDFMQDYFSFFRKIVIELRKCKLST